MALIKIYVHPRKYTNKEGKESQGYKTIENLSGGKVKVRDLRFTSDSINEMKLATEKTTGKEWDFLKDIYIAVDPSNVWVTEENYPAVIIKKMATKFVEVPQNEIFDFEYKEASRAMNFDCTKPVLPTKINEEDLPF